MAYMVWSQEMPLVMPGSDRSETPLWRPPPRYRPVPTKITRLLLLLLTRVSWGRVVIGWTRVGLEPSVSCATWLMQGPDPVAGASQAPVLGAPRSRRHRLPSWSPP